MKTGAVLIVGLLACASARAGDRPGVLAELDAIAGNWPSAQLEASVVGQKDGEVVLGADLAFAYRAGASGHAALLHVSSHGDMTLLRGNSGKPAPSGRSETLQAAEPLGTETVYVLFSDEPLDALLAGRRSPEAGDTRDAARAIATRIEALKAGQKLAVAKVQYLLVAKAGGTEYTTRGIVRKIVDADEDLGGAPAGKPQPAAKLPARIEFALNSAELTRQGRLDLDTFGEAMLSPELADRAIVLEGHTDDTGDDAYNCALSQRRAQAARTYLLASFGIPAARVQVAGFGESRPLVPNDSDAARRQNRRVEFAFGKPGEKPQVPVTPCR